MTQEAPVCGHDPRCSSALPDWCWPHPYIASLVAFVQEAGGDPVTVAALRGPGMRARVVEHLQAA